MTEHESQCAVFEWYRHVALLRWPEMVMYATPNAAKMSPRAASYMRAEGRTAGVPDLVVACPRRGYGALYVEMKSERGVLSDEQKSMLKRLSIAGNLVSVCRSSDEAIEIITEYMEG